LSYFWSSAPSFKTGGTAADGAESSPLAVRWGGTPTCALIPGHKGSPHMAMLGRRFINLFSRGGSSASGSSPGGTFPDDTTSANEFLILFI